jgi:hypothetical protein
MKGTHRRNKDFVAVNSKHRQQRRRAMVDENSPQPIGTLCFDEQRRARNNFFIREIVGNEKLIRIVHAGVIEEKKAFKSQLVAEKVASNPERGIML